ncbi:hypothetical protein M0802_000364 [Mischocyttarus mexicanus]|nr:hypothetical protein M0802_000364 [Mischocyttarus mexicanus]
MTNFKASTTPDIVLITEIGRGEDEKKKRYLLGRRRLKQHRQRFTRINRQNGNRLVAHGKESCGTQTGAEANAQLQPSGTVCLAQHAAAAGRLRPMATGFVPKMLEEIKKEKRQKIL